MKKKEKWFDPDRGPTEGQFWAGIVAFILVGVAFMKKLVGIMYKGDEKKNSVQ